MTVVGLCLAFQDHARGALHYKEQRAHKRANDMLVELYGTTPAAKFGPNELRLVREAMINAGWCRNYVNHQTRRIVRMFKWAVAHGHVTADVYMALATIEPLRKRTSRAPETEPVRPVDPKLIDPIKPFVAPQVWDIIQLQRLTGARGDELLKLRKGDIEAEKGAKVWKAQLKEYKTEYLKHDRIIMFGPQCQKILRPYLLRRAPGEYLFSPREADKKRREEFESEAGQARHADSLWQSSWHAYRSAGPPQTRRAVQPGFRPPGHRAGLRPGFPRAA